MLEVVVVVVSGEREGERGILFVFFFDFVLASIFFLERTDGCAFYLNGLEVSQWKSRVNKSQSRG